ncbi:hypothetical protein BROUX41_005260 [Berkeleyomyces rouxiae]|uniref:uncharacterized protein n=1 Tax=Berkeleyomyces rouxiae TaxID=2035830 RepID=UPI003B771823
MSSRQLRKLREKQELEALAQRKADGLVDAEGESEEEPEVFVAKPQRSLFAALGDEGDDDDDDDDEPEADDEAQNATAPDTHAPPQPVPEAAAKKKKNRGKKKKKGKKAAAPESKSGKEPDLGGGDDIDRILAEFSAKDNSVSPRAQRLGTGLEANKLFAINPRNLKERTEMIAVFGRDVITAAASENQVPPQLRDDGTMTLEDVLRTYYKGKLPDVTLKRNIFIDGKESWPKASAEGLMMEKVNDNKHEVWTEYRFVGNSLFNQIKKVFYSMARMGDLGSMIGGLRSCPYHVMYLLQCYLIAKDHDKNHAVAADLTQRALFTFGRVSLSSFRKDVEAGAARLDFARPENRQFFLAGYRNIRTLVQKGAYRTAFEWAKLLIGLQPTKDVYGMNHVVHMLAVRIHQVEWLEAFLAWYKDSDVVEYAPEHAYYRHSLVPGLLKQGRDNEAQEMLLQNIELMPWLYCQLFQALEIDAAPAIWGVQPPSEEDNLFTALYIAYGKDLWNTPEIKATLRATALKAKRADTLEATNVVVDLRTTRFIYLENNTELMGHLPSGALAAEPNYDFDPLPPAQTENIFADPDDSWPWEETRATRGGGGGGGDVDGLDFGGLNLQNLGGVGDLARRLMGGLFGGAAGAGAGAGAGLGMGQGLTDEEAIAALLEADELEAEGLGDEVYDDEFGGEDLEELQGGPARPFQATVEEVVDDEENEDIVPVAGAGAGGIR